MILFGLAYLGGVLTILSPCILPVLPFVFARADRPLYQLVRQSHPGGDRTFEIRFLDPDVQAFTFTFG